MSRHRNVVGTDVGDSLMSSKPYSSKLKVIQSPDSESALSSSILFSPRDYESFSEGGRNRYVRLVRDGDSGGLLYGIAPHDGVPTGSVALSAVMRKSSLVSPDDTVIVTVFQVGNDAQASVINFEVDFRKKSQDASIKFESEELSTTSHSLFDSQMVNMDQELLVECKGVKLVFFVRGVSMTPLVGDKKASGTASHSNFGIVTEKTVFLFSKKEGSKIKIGGLASGQQNILINFDFEKLGIGGLDAEFSQIFRRAFASRVLPTSVTKKLGIQHVKGILMYGPPGCGKTLMARQIGKMLNAKPPIIVDGPSILNKYVGESEQNVRNLFAPAEKDQKELGDESPLHIIIFDEIDSICRARGSRNDSTGVGDTVVNQLLSKMDGVDVLNNILIIGMTNRKDMIDEAILRPGRLEVHLEIGLPDLVGRVQILKIHTGSMAAHNKLAPDFDVDAVAAMLNNYTGAEIASVVKAAASYPVGRLIDVHKVSVTLEEAEGIQVGMEDFQRATEEVKPMFGRSENLFQDAIRNGIIDFGPRYQRVLKDLNKLVTQTRSSSRTPLVTCLIEGTIGSGKTATAAKIALESEFPFIRMISPAVLLNSSEGGRCDRIMKAFNDAYKSPLAVIVIDDLERILEYVHIGPRFSNSILQTLLVYLKQAPPPGHKLLVLVTTSNPELIDLLMNGDESFSTRVTLPTVSSSDEMDRILHELLIFSDAERKAIVDEFSGSVPIKQLLMMLEMARQEVDVADAFLDRLTDYQASRLAKESKSSSLYMSDGKGKSEA